MNRKWVCIIAVGGLVTGGVGYFVAPAIASLLGGVGILGAASTGTTITTLSGAALTNASLAAIGGGALAAGGTGIAGGTTIITTVAAVGGAAGAAGIGSAISSDFETE